MVLTTLLAALAVAQTAPATPTLPTRIYLRANAPQNERKVSLRVAEASLKDVLGKLPKVDYAVDADAFKDRRITLSLSDVPLRGALDAIAAALDARWETVGGVHVLRKGAGFGLSGTAFRTFNLPNSDKGYRFFGDGGQLLPKGFSPEGSRRIYGFPKGFKGFSPEQQKEMEKAMEEARKQFQNLRTPDGEFQKALERARADDGPMNEETRKAIEKARAEIDARQKEIEAQRRAVPKPPLPIGDNVGNPDLLLKSLTPVQRELAKRQGYLKVSDLTPEQRRMTGYAGGSGSFTMTVTRDGDSITIKG